ncbi:BofC C-terminal domain-containing protein [Crassaminicella indica]|uniref:BofC C-terminal domain-containing protein n=1 Tax=Crassaminicella indica TaxID=2855394 RepID=A0ABX8RA41_9CLOT|nr:BofC C-terminal domain-containing protein [Crassaminicella indica]QXM05924.1 BofC C-terminal domain-containing protein [Crassaminicella indica]
MWRRRRRRKGKIFVGCLVLLMIGFAYGYVTNDSKMPKHIKNNNENALNIGEIAVKIPKHHEEQKENVKKQDPINEHSLIVSEENIVTDNTQIVFNTYYKKTRDMIKKKRRIPRELIGKNLDELRDYLNKNYAEWDIRECNKDKIELYQVTDEIPPNFYIAKEYNGYIAIFQVDEKGEYILKETTEIPISSLSNMDAQYVKNGIVKKNREEIDQILEDYSS